MPGWHEATRVLQEEGKIQLVGLIQEQHPDRCRLFMQWKEMGWPILVDPINVTGTMVVPETWAIDEYGVVRISNPRRTTFEADFINQTYPEPEGELLSRSIPAPGSAENEGEASRVRTRGDIQFLHENDLAGAIESYEEAIALDPSDGSNHFRLGVALRKRYDSQSRRTGDFQAAVDAWTTALSLNPNQYIWRRRIQQYGPRLEKPYPFYDWVEQARSDIKARGEIPVELAVEPRGAELAQPSRELAVSDDELSGITVTHPDPQNRVYRDNGPEDLFVEAEPVVVPARIEPGGSLRLHLIFRPRPGSHWNNEAEPLRVWLNLPDGWQSDRKTAMVASAETATSDEERRVEFELLVPEGQTAGEIEVVLEAFYNVCHDDGICLFRRKDIRVTVPIISGGN